MWHCVEMFRLTPLNHGHKLCNITCFPDALKHNKSSSNNHTTLIRDVLKFTLKIFRHPLHCNYNIYNVTGLLP